MSLSTLFFFFFVISASFAHVEVQDSLCQKGLHPLGITSSSIRTCVFVSPSFFEEQLPAATESTTIIYDAKEGSLENGFENWSWGATNVEATTYRYPGSSYSCSLVVTNYEALYFAGSFGSPFEKLMTVDFFVNGGASSGEPLSVQILADNTPVGATLSLNDYLPSHALQKNTWVKASIPFADFSTHSNPVSASQYVDGIWFQATTGNTAGTVYFDTISFATDLSPSPPPPPSQVGLTVPSLSSATPFSRKIFGVNFGTLEQLEANYYTVNRWGGNAVTRYNWQIDVQNHAADWYFENINNDVDVNALPYGTSSDNFINETLKGNSSPFLTLSTIGLTPTDRQNKRCGFSVKKYGSQTDSDPWDSDCGSGVSKSTGKDITGNDPSDTSSKVDPSFNLKWLDHISEAFGPKVAQNIDVLLDNEPALWSSSHRDVHPKPLTYDELWNMTVTYSLPLKTSPEYKNVKIHGPVFWGWCAYMYSAADGCQVGGDRKAHGNMPQLQWYISQVGEYYKEHGILLVDKIDIHTYPQASNVAFSSDEDAQAAYNRLQSTRSLYDPSYTDPSWINQPVYILPLVKQWIAEYCPQLELTVSEYNWGADNIVTGAVAHAEVLSILAVQGVSTGARWVSPASGSRAEDSFAILLNYDGEGTGVPSRVLNISTSSIEEVTAYGFYGPAVMAGSSSDSDGEDKLCILLIGKTRDEAADVSIDLRTVDGFAQGSYEVFGFNESQRLGPMGSSTYSSGMLEYTVEPYSATLLVITPSL